MLDHAVCCESCCSSDVVVVVHVVETDVGEVHVVVVVHVVEIDVVAIVAHIHFHVSPDRDKRNTHQHRASGAQRIQSTRRCRQDMERYEKAAEDGREEV